MASERLPGESPTLPSLALREADTHRSVRAYFVVGVVATVGVAGLLVLSGPPALRWTLLAATALTGATAFWLAWTRRRAGVFSDAEASFVGVLMCTTAVVAMAYVGPLTAPAVMLVALVMGLALGNPGRARGLAVLITGGYACVGVLALAGWVEPVSSLFADDDKLAHAFAIVLVETVLAAAYYIGVSARSATTAALEHVERARVALAGRDALLQEAFDDLRRMAGGQGRLSGAQLGRHRLETLLGRGGMGEVYRAKDLQDGVAVAVKVLHANLAAEPSLVKRFFREADVSSALESPHIVKVREHGLASDGSPYLAMELVEGRSLGEILRESLQLNLEQVVQLCRDVCAALDVAHRAGIVHRDVKLANLMQRTDGRWVLLDFGISRLHTSSGTLTRGGPIGTPGYMPPEQIEGTRIDGRADMFALGVVLYRALTGRPPFRGKDALATLYHTVHEQPPQPSTIAPMPQDVELLLVLALAKSPDHRPLPAAFADAFAQAAAGALSHELRARARALSSQMPWARGARPEIIGRGADPDDETATQRAPGSVRP